MRVYTAEGAQIGEFGEERRSLVSIKAVPEQLKHAILAAEDDEWKPSRNGLNIWGVAWW